MCVFLILIINYWWNKEISFVVLQKGYIVISINCTWIVKLQLDFIKNDSFLRIQGRRYRCWMLWMWIFKICIWFLGDSNRIGKEKVEHFLKSKDIKEILKTILTDEDKAQILINLN